MIMSVSLAEITRAAQARRAPLAGESAGYLVLAVADQILGAPRAITKRDVVLTEEGSLRVVRGDATSEAQAERMLRTLLDELSMVASSGSAALSRAGRRTSNVGLSALVRELEAALIPVNRAAARRTLARLYRETTRAMDSGAVPTDLAEGSLAEIEPVESVAECLHLAEPVAREVACELPMSLPRVALAPALCTVPDLIIEMIEDDHAGEERAPDLVIDVAIEDDIAADDGWEDETRTIHVASEEPSGLASDDESNGALETRALGGAANEAELQEEPETAILPCVTDIDLEATSYVDVVEEASDELTVALDLAIEAAPESDELTLALELAIEVVAEGDELPAQVVECTDEPAQEACTRPEPVILRASQRPAPAPVCATRELLPSEVSAPPPDISTLTPPPSEADFSALTPALGTLVAQLPVLSRAAIEELSAERAAEDAIRNALSAARAVREPLGPASGMHSVLEPEPEGSPEALLLEEHTESMPDVAPLTHGTAIVSSHMSEVSELVAGFAVGEVDTNLGLCRAIKDMAELDLTPAPFAALIR
jgi:hypothetical protein